MSNVDRQTPAPPAVTVESGQTTPAPVGASDVLAIADANAPVLAQPEMLVEGLRYLQKRIPEFTQLSWQEKRSHAAAASLDPEFIEGGLRAAAVFRDTQMLVRRDSEELRKEEEEIRRWDQVIAEMEAITSGIKAANLKRKHRLGKAILRLYKMMGVYLQGGPEHAYLRPYYENMKRAYLRRRQLRKRKAKEEPAGE